MRLMIVDDEGPARERLRSLVAELGEPFVVVAEAGNGLEALQTLDAAGVDLVLMDIRMPVMDGLEAARHLSRSEAPPAVIFVTAYDQHALEAFEHNALDYLLKPVRLARLEKALSRARQLTGRHQRALAEMGEATEARRTHLCARYRGNLMLVPVSDVLYFRADSKYVRACHVGGEMLLEDSLKVLEQEFAPDFLRIHRSALVARDRLAGLEKLPDGRCLVRLEGLEQGLEVSRRHLPRVRRSLKRQPDKP